MAYCFGAARVRLFGKISEDGRLRIVAAGLRIAGIVAIAHGLMLLGADEITTIERGGIRTIRSAGEILALYGADPAPWMTANLPEAITVAAAYLFALPGWLILFVIGAALTLFMRERL